MDDRNYFDINTYFRDMAVSNKLAAENGFHFCTCSGIENLQDPLQKFRSEHAFFCVDDTNDGSFSRGGQGGWFKNRTITVFLLHRYRQGDMEDRARKLDLCRQLFRQIMSKMVVDKDDLSNELIYLQTETILCSELGQYFMSGCTGLYFMIDLAEPVDIVYTSDEWII